MSYDYKVVQFEPVVGENDRRAARKIGPRLEKLIREHATGGWELHEVATAYVTVKPGCIAAILGAGASWEPVTEVIFKRGTS
jgi:hypothetical protein